MTTPQIVILDGATLNPGDNPWTEIEALGEVEDFADSTPEQTAERLAGRFKTAHIVALPTVE